MRSPTDDGAVTDRTQRAPFSDAVKAFDEIEATNPEQLTDEELRAEMRWRETLRRRNDGRDARLLAEDHRRHQQLKPGKDEWRPSSTEWLQEHRQISSSAAYAQVQVATKLAALPGTAKAFAEGTLSAQHVSVICRAMDELRRCDLGRDPKLVDRIEEQLRDGARCMTPKDLLHSWHQTRYQLDQQAGVEAEREQYERRWLNLTQTPWGTYRIQGELDAEGGTRLRTALTVLAKRRSKDDDRSPTRRRGDSLVELADRALDSGKLPERGGERPHLLITATLDTLQLKPGSPLAKLDWGATITGESARRIACDAIITPVLVNKKGDVLHVGSASRVVPPRMRKALNIRDETCRHPGCTMPAADCNPHHRHHFADGGPTIPGNFTLYCSTHHRLRHPENARFSRQPPRGDPP